MHIVLTIDVSNNWPNQQIDVNNVFLKGVSEEVIYMVQPPSFEAKRKTRCVSSTKLYMD